MIVSLASAGASANGMGVVTKFLEFGMAIFLFLVELCKAQRKRVRILDSGLSCATLSAQFDVL